MRKRINVLKAGKGLLKAIPNSLTLCNSLCGFFAIINAALYYQVCLNGGQPSEKVFLISAVMILFAMIFDCLDGFTARLLNACSMHGIQMDSLADMVTFGVAPAALMIIMACTFQGLTRGQFVLFFLMSAVYLGGAALRLATYNVHAMVEKKSSDKFSGLPSPGAAAAICTVVILSVHMGWNLAEVRFLLPAYGAVLGLLMVSPVPYLHIGKWLTTVKRSWKRMVIVALILICAAVQIQWTAFLFVNGYVLIGLIAGIIKMLCRKSEA